MHQKQPPPKVRRSVAVDLSEEDSVFTGLAEKASGAMAASVTTRRERKRIFTMGWNSRTLRLPTSVCCSMRDIASPPGSRIRLLPLASCQQRFDDIPVHIREPEVTTLQSIRQPLM